MKGGHRRLLISRTRVPRRYVEVAKLMQDDLSGLKPESLGRHCPRMDDIKQRRVATGLAPRSAKWKMAC